MGGVCDQMGDLLFVCVIDRWLAVGSTVPVRDRGEPRTGLLLESVPGDWEPTHPAPQLVMPAAGWVVGARSNGGIFLVRDR